MERPRPAGRPLHAASPSFRSTGNAPLTSNTRSDDPAALRDLLERGLDEAGHRASASQVDALLALALLLDQWAGRINLTGHRSPDSIVRRLVLEAAALDRCLPEVADLVDLGSGAGFPGLPLAILRPGRRITLVESRLRRHHFQRAALRELGLENAEALLGRAEALDARPHAAAIAQAMARPARALSLMRPWVAAGGWLLLPGSEDPPEIGPVAGIEPVDRLSYRVPCGGPPRTLSRLRRIAERESM